MLREALLDITNGDGASCTRRFSHGRSGGDGSLGCSYGLGTKVVQVCVHLLFTLQSICSTAYTCMNKKLILSTHRETVLLYMCLIHYTETLLTVSIRSSRLKLPTSFANVTTLESTLIVVGTIDYQAEVVITLVCSRSFVQESDLIHFRGFCYLKLRVVDTS